MLYMRTVQNLINTEFEYKLVHNIYEWVVASAGAGAGMATGRVL